MGQIPTLACPGSQILGFHLGVLLLRFQGRVTKVLDLCSAACTQGGTFLQLSVDPPKTSLHQQPGQKSHRVMIYVVAASKADILRIHFIKIKTYSLNLGFTDSAAEGL